MRLHIIITIQQSKLRYQINIINSNICLCKNFTKTPYTSGYKIGMIKKEINN